MIGRLSGNDEARRIRKPPLPFIVVPASIARNVIAAVTVVHAAVGAIDIAAAPVRASPNVVASERNLRLDRQSNERGQTQIPKLSHLTTLSVVFQSGQWMTNHRRHFTAPMSVVSDFIEKFLMLCRRWRRSSRISSLFLQRMQDEPSMTRGSSHAVSSQGGQQLFDFPFDQVSDRTKIIRRHFFGIGDLPVDAMLGKDERAFITASHGDGRVE